MIDILSIATFAADQLLFPGIAKEFTSDYVIYAPNGFLVEIKEVKSRRSSSE